MRYFIELLESYSKLKKRNLSLLSERSGGAVSLSQLDPQAVAAADQLINNAIAQKDQHGKAARVPTNIGNSEIWISKGANSADCGPTNPSNPQDNVLFNGFGNQIKCISKTRHPENYAKFVNFLAGKTGGQQGAAEESPQQEAPQDLGMPMQPMMVDPMAPGAAITNSLAAKLSSDPNKVLATIESFNNIQALLPELERAGIQLDPMLIFGSSPESIESQMANCQTFKTKTNKGKKTSKITSNSDIDLTKIVAESFEDIFKVASKKNKSTKDIALLKNRIAIVEGTQEVIIYGRGKEDGMVFSDTNGFLKSIISNIEQSEPKFKAKIQPVSFDVSKGNSAVVLRSKFLEELPTLIAYKGENKEQVGKFLISKFSGKYHELLEGVNKLRELQLAGVPFATDADNDMQSVKRILTLAGEGTINDTVIKGITDSVKKSLGNRNPDRSIPAGKLTGLGNRQDAIEIYKSEEELISTLKSMGMSSEDIEKYGFIKKRSVEDVYGSDSDNKKLLDLDPEYKKKLKDKVSVLEIGYKFYESAHEDGKLGDSFDSTFQLFMKGNSKIYDPRNHKDPKIKAAYESDIKFRQAMGEALGFDVTIGSYDMRNLESYGKKFDGVSKTIDNLKLETHYTTGSGRKVKYSFQDFCDKTLEELVKNSDYKEIFGDPPDTEKASLYDYLSDLKYEKLDESGIKRIKLKVSTYIRNKKLSNDCIRGKEPDRTLAKRTLALRMMHTGASNSHSLLTSFNDITGGNSYLFRHNEAFGLVKDFLDGKCKLDFKSGSFRLSNSDDPEDFVKLNVANVKGRSGPTRRRKYSFFVSQKRMQNLAIGRGAKR